MSAPLRIGTRGSKLAMWQANEVARQLRERGRQSEIVTITTTGDKRQDVSLAAIGGKGLFIKELEEALDRDEIDLAVHSLKDVPSLLPESSTSTSSANFALATHSPMRVASFFATMTTASESFWRMSRVAGV